ncbi:hypothetical protein [uncultured Hyphomonas sp.]|uniref:hypothetical protein n=1 Tax=uncultured Hyphomonas sp. TaxID=225298 RepID=UPI002AAB6424|nr:hypothetical protein [uncultured Hyphomonas sp.]
MTLNTAAIEAQAELHHQYLLGLELIVATREGPEVVGDWMFRLFRRQHEDKFLSSFRKLGLDGLPDAVACAKYHVLSNGVGGVAVEYMEESDTKAWVRFRYPRWMYDGAVICGVPVEASRGFLRGWYGQNGVSLGNPRLGFVCVSEDMTGQFGLCGYFREYDHDLSEDERLRFAPDERPPPFDPAKQPAPPPGEWTPERLAKANRNYAVEYIRNGVRELVNVLGQGRALELCHLAARLTGLQHYRRMADAVGGMDGGPAEAAEFLAAMFVGMGDEARAEPAGDGAVVRQSGLRIVRGLDGAERDNLLSCWIEIWRGAVHSQRAFMDVACEPSADGLNWRISPAAE